METYSIMVITPADALEGEEKKQLSMLVDFMAKHQGKVTEPVLWSAKRTFSYPIRKKTTGNYWLISCSLPPSLVPELRSKLQSNPFIIRFLITLKA